SAPLRSTQDSAQVLVLDHDFTGPHEIVRVFLQDGQVYRAELSSPNVALEIRGVVRTIQAPHVYPFLPSQTPSGSTFLEIYPEKDAEYEILSRGIGGTRLPTRLRLYRDVGASARRQHVRANRSWEIGIELGGGWHSGFVQSGALPVIGSDPEGGTDVEGCFTARGAKPSSRFSVCVLGVGHQSQHGARSILWVYTEPRVRLLRLAGTGRSGWELGPLFRFGAGMISASQETPVLVAPGFYLARSIGGSRGGGWTLQGAYTRAFYRNFTRPAGAERASPNGHRVSFSVGWYR
ncbi:MAG TPA: hypothetical protein VFH24_04300, partial [Gemmatimonadales bacterium]|nr:hypothetical protein [Gemmatimonadales bacterium]